MKILSSSLIPLPMFCHFFIKKNVSFLFVLWSGHIMHIQLLFCTEFFFYAFVACSSILVIGE